MTTTFAPSAHRAELSRVARDVFHTLLGYEVRETEEPAESSSRSITAILHFSGAWKGAVRIECSPDLARFVTSRLLGIAVPSEVDDDTKDAMGEVINTVGGNLKALLPRGTSLSMPCVEEGHASAQNASDSEDNVRIHFQSELGPMWITLTEVTDKDTWPCAPR